MPFSLAGPSQIPTEFAAFQIYANAIYVGLLTQTHEFWTADYVSKVQQLDYWFWADQSGNISTDKEMQKALAELAGYLKQHDLEGPYAVPLDSPNIEPIRRGLGEQFFYVAIVATKFYPLDVDWALKIDDMPLMNFNLATIAIPMATEKDWEDAKRKLAIQKGIVGEEVSKYCALKYANAEPVAAETVAPGPDQDVIADFSSHFGTCWINNGCGNEKMGSLSPRQSAIMKLFYDDSRRAEPRGYSNRELRQRSEVPGTLRDMPQAFRGKANRLLDLLFRKEGQRYFVKENVTIRLRT